MQKIVIVNTESGENWTIELVPKYLPSISLPIRGIGNLHGLTGVT